MVNLLNEQEARHHAEIAKLTVETDLKLLAKWDPKCYGDKIDVTQTNRVAPMTKEQMIKDMRQSPAFRREIGEILAESAE
jgi:hypothetical protein